MAFLFKKKRSTIADSLRKGASSIYDRISSRTIDYIQDKIEDISYRVEQKIEDIQLKFMKRMFALGALALACFLIVLSAVFFLIEYVGWSASLSLLVVGIIVGVIGIIIKNNAKGGK